MDHLKSVPWSVDLERFHCVYKDIGIYVYILFPQDTEYIIYIHIYIYVCFLNSEVSTDKLIVCFCILYKSDA